MLLLAEQITINLDPKLAEKLAGWLDSQNDSWSGVTFSSAVGGFVAVLAYFVIRLLVSCSRAKRTVFREYQIANSQNQEIDKGTRGEIHQGCGIRVDGIEHLKRIGAQRAVWAYSKKNIPKDGQHRAIFYGPYTSDFAHAGRYAAKLRLRADGVSNINKSGLNPVVFELEVARQQVEFINENGNTRLIQMSPVVARRFIRLSDLKDGEWLILEVEFFADGTGIWEYRGWPYDGLNDGRPDAMSLCGDDFVLYFDSISLESRPELKIPDL